MDRLSALMQQKLEYLSQVAKITTENIVSSELKGALRKEIQPFYLILQHSFFAKDNLGRKYKDIRNFNIKKSNIFITKDEISREMESLKMTRLTRENDNIVQIMKKFSEVHARILGR